MVPNAVENQVVTPVTLGEILLSLISDLIRADGSDHFHIPRTAYAGDFRAERLSDLHSEGTDASRRTVNQGLLSRLDVPVVAKTLQCGESRYRYGGCLLEGHVIRLHDQCRPGSAHILGEGALRGPDFHS